LTCGDLDLNEVTFYEKGTDAFAGADADPIGGSWTTLTGAWGSVRKYSNSLTASVANTWARASFGGVTLGNNQYAQATLIKTGATTGAHYAVVGIRHSLTADTHYDIYAACPNAENTYKLYRAINGSYTDLGSFGTPADGDVIRLAAIGTSIIVYINGAELLRVMDTNISSGYPMLGAFNAGDNSVLTRLSNFSCGDDSPPATEDAQVISDDFNRSDENPLAGNWTPIHGSGLKLIWNGVCGINSNTYNTSVRTESFHPDQYAIATFGVSGGYGDYQSLVLRGHTTGGINYYSWQRDAGTPTVYYCQKFVNGTETNIATVTSGPNANTYPRQRFTVIGSTLTAAYWNGSTWVDIYTTTDTDITHGAPGLRDYKNRNNEAILLDDFECGDFPPEGDVGAVMNSQFFVMLLAGGGR
jgi:hypothetical protein